MTKDTLLALAASLGLQSPRIILFKPRKGDTVLNLHHGPANDRKTISIEPKATEAQARAAIEAA